MKTPEEIKKALDICQSKRLCDGCPYDPDCAENRRLLIIPDVRDYLQQLEEENERLHEQVCLMLIQMRGDCGTCKHREDAKKCNVCAREDGSPMWEYEGLPEVGNHAESSV